jgi:hypothetical protein
MKRAMLIVAAAFIAAALAAPALAQTRTAETSTAKPEMTNQLFNVQVQAVDEMELAPEVRAVPLSGPTQCLAEDNIFSQDAADYSATLRMSSDGKTCRLVMYGRLTAGKDLTSAKTLREQWPTLTTSTNTTVKLVNFELGGKKIFIWFGNEAMTPTSAAELMKLMLIESYLNKANCDVVVTKDADEEGQLFRCELYYELPNPNDKTLAELLESLSTIPMKFWFTGSNFLCTSPMTVSLGELMTAGKVDADLDSVPDAVDNCPAVRNYSQEYTAGNDTGDACVAPVAAEEGTEPMAVATSSAEGGTTGLTTNFPEATVNEEGAGHCSLAPAAAFNPIGIALIGLAAIAPIVRRLKRR